MDINKGEAKFKIVDKSKQQTSASTIATIKNGRVGSVCVQTSGFSIEDTKEMIMAEVRRQTGESTYPTLMDSKLRKTQLCDMYEYWLRRASFNSGARAPMTFMRPAVFSVYKEHVV
jgi:hypothetical protein